MTTNELNLQKVLAVAADGKAVLYVDGVKVCNVTLNPEELVQFAGGVGDGSIRIGKRSRLFFPNWAANTNATIHQSTD